MPPYLDLIGQFLDNEEWDYSVQENPTHTFLLSSFTGETTRLDVVFDTLPDAETVMCYAYLPVVVPVPLRSATAELTARINYRLTVASFDFDADEGVLRVRNAIDLEGGELTPIMLRNLRDSAISIADFYNAAYMRVVYGGVPPRQALDELLAQPPEDDSCPPAGRRLQ